LKKSAQKTFGSLRAALAPAEAAKHRFIAVLEKNNCLIFCF